MSDASIVAGLEAELLGVKQTLKTAESVAVEVNARLADHRRRVEELTEQRALCARVLRAETIGAPVPGVRASMDIATVDERLAEAIRERDAAARDAARENAPIDGLRGRCKSLAERCDVMKMVARQKRDELRSRHVIRAELQGEQRALDRKVTHNEGEISRLEGELIQLTGHDHV